MFKKPLTWILIAGGAAVLWLLYSAEQQLQAASGALQASSASLAQSGQQAAASLAKASSAVTGAANSVQDTADEADQAISPITKVENWLSGLFGGSSSGS